MMKRWLLLIVLQILLGTQALSEGIAAIRTEDEVLYEQAIALLHRVNDVESIVQAKSILEAITSNYGDADLYVIYADALASILDLDTDTAKLDLAILTRIDAFEEKLEDNGLPTSKELSVYVAARQAESIGEITDAIDLYRQILILDSAQRARDLMGQVREEQYLEAMMLFESGKYAAAAEILEGLAGYKDSARKAQEARQLEPTIVPTVTPSPTVTPQPTPTLKPIISEIPMTRGNNGDDIVELQMALIENNFLYDIADGIYGPKTEEAVRRAQELASLPKTGIADLETQLFLVNNSAKFEPRTNYALSMYALTMDYNTGVLEIHLKNMGTATVIAFECMLIQCNSSKKELGDFYGGRNNGEYTYSSKMKIGDFELVSGECLPIEMMILNGLQSVFSDGDERTIQIFEDGVYFKVVAQSFTTSDGENHALEQTLYCKINNS